MNKKIVNIAIIFFSIIVLELVSQSIVLIFEQKYSLILKPVSNVISKKINKNYIIEWDYSNNKMKPGQYKLHDVSYTINSKGFRGKEFDFKKKNIRVICFGGSTTIGLESPDDYTYPYLLEQFLNQEKKKYEVLNMGFSSKSLNFIKNLFFNEAYKYSPDIITIYSNRNSLIYDGSSLDPSFENSLIVKYNYFLQENIMTYRLLWKVYKKFINLTITSKKIKSPYSLKGIDKNYLLTGYKNSLSEIITYAKKNNITVILVKQAYYFKPNIIKEIEKLSILDLINLYEKEILVKKYNLDEENHFYSIFGTILNKNLDEFKNFKNVIIVDPISSLISSEKNFVDYLHLTPKGNSVLAKELAFTIKKYYKLN